MARNSYRWVGSLSFINPMQNTSAVEKFEYGKSPWMTAREERGNGTEKQRWIEADARIDPNQPFLIKYNCRGQVDRASIWFDFLSKRDPLG